jgi:hypothetical protein
MRSLARVDEELLRWSVRLPAEERLRQANAAFRLQNALHGASPRPLFRSFDTIEEHRRFAEENGLRG